MCAILRNGLALAHTVVRARHNKRLGVRFLDFLISDFCTWQNALRLQHSSQEFPFRVSATGRTLFAMAVHPKVFIVVRNKGVVPKQRRVERLPSGYSVRDSRDDSEGSYWYVVTALEVVPSRNT
jgi:hypothetical protein